VAWEHGSRRRGEDVGPPIQVHAADPHTFILRQSKSVHYEAPFLYLFCGNERALLLDTGATGDPADFPLRATVDTILRAWLAEHPRQHYELVVAHSHAHGDHVAADAQFADRPDTTVVPPDLASVQAFFGFTTWPQQVVRLDLGGRVLEVTGCPGHHPTSIAVLDPWSGFLLTGDTVYPGRLYVDDMPSFLASLDRLVAQARSRGVTAVMGCHIEMSRTPGRGARGGRPSGRARVRRRGDLQRPLPRRPDPAAPATVGDGLQAAGTVALNGRRPVRAPVRTARRAAARCASFAW
jgi:glyoxylase-like metal-dependent hydrolase (beta-lactamase superfamily II)